jgi:hypothetical protein
LRYNRTTALIQIKPNSYWRSFGRSTAAIT